MINSTVRSSGRPSPALDQARAGHIGVPRVHEPNDGPLAGLRVIELAGIGPIQLAGTLLADLGAAVVRVERPGGQPFVPPPREVLHRSRPSLALDLRRPDGSEVVLRMVDQADVLIEAFRPGVAERLGLGPDVCLERNGRLIYAQPGGVSMVRSRRARATISTTWPSPGALAAIGRSDGSPVPPLNLVADFGGGTMFVLLGILAALHERHTSGQGQVIDAAMIDGASCLMTMVYGHLANGLWRNERGANMLDGGRAVLRHLRLRRWPVRRVRRHPTRARSAVLADAGRIRGTLTAPGADSADVLARWNFSGAEIADLIGSGTVVSADEAPDIVSEPR